MNHFLKLNGIRLGCFLFLSILGLQCKPRLKTLSQSQDIKQNSNPVIDQKLAHFSTLDYMNACKAEGIDFPDKLDCFAEDSMEIPVYETAPDGAYQPVDFRHGTTDESSAPNVSDPPLLNQAPFPFSRIQRMAVNNTSCVMVCRRYLYLPKDDVNFHDINIICHNPKNGATCFLNNILYTKPQDPNIYLPIDGKHLPLPGSKEDQVKPVWMTLELMNEHAQCSRCHTADPFIHTPYVDQLKVNGKDLVPHFSQGLYHVVPGDLLYKWPKLKQFVAEDAAPCTSCHRIGNLTPDNCRLIRQAAGVQQISHCTKNCGTLDHPSWYYMPPRKPSPEDEPKYIKAIQKIDQCCNNKNQSGCDYEDIE